MSTILDEIVASKRHELAAAKANCSEAELEKRLRAAAPCRGFRAGLLASAGVAIIAEVKKASPSGAGIGAARTSTPSRLPKPMRPTELPVSVC